MARKDVQLKKAWDKLHSLADSIIFDEEVSERISDKAQKIIDDFELTVDSWIISDKLGTIDHGNVSQIKSIMKYAAKHPNFVILDVSEDYEECFFYWSSFKKAMKEIKTVEKKLKAIKRKI